MVASPTALSLLMSMIEKAKAEGRLPSDFQTPTKFENYDNNEVKKKTPSSNLSPLTTLAAKKGIGYLMTPSADTIPNGVATSIDGGTILSDGTTVGSEGLTSAPGTMGQVMGGAGAAYGTYKALDDMQHGGSGRAGLTTAGAGVGSMVGGPVGAAVGAGIGNIAGYGYQGDGWKNDVALGLVSPGALIAKKMGYSPIHKTTRQVAQEHTSQLADQGEGDPEWMKYLEGMRTQHNAPPPDPSKPFAGKYANWDEYMKGGLEAKDLSGVYGNLRLGGPDWAKYSQAKREAITQGLIDANLYASKKGEVDITDDERAKQIMTDIGGSFVEPTAQNAQTQTSTRQKAPAKQNRGGRMPPQIPLAPEAPIMPMGPETQPLPTTVEEFSQAFQAALGKVRGLSDVPNPLLRSNL